MKKLGLSLVVAGLVSSSALASTSVALDKRGDMLVFPTFMVSDDYRIRYIANEKTLDINNSLNSGNGYDYNTLSDASTSLLTTYNAGINAYANGTLAESHVNRNLATTVRVVNTSDTEAVVAKVVVRNWRNSAELIDFLIFLSPSDIWEGTIARDGLDLNNFDTATGTMWTNRAFESSKVGIADGNSTISNVYDVNSNVNLGAVTQADRGSNIYSVDDSHVVRLTQNSAGSSKYYYVNVSATDPFEEFVISSSTIRANQVTNVTLDNIFDPLAGYVEVFGLAKIDASLIDTSFEVGKQVDKVSIAKAYYENFDTLAWADVEKELAGEATLYTIDNDSTNTVTDGVKVEGLKMSFEATAIESAGEEANAVSGAYDSSFANMVVNGNIKVQDFLTAVSKEAIVVPFDLGYDNSLNAAITPAYNTKVNHNVYSGDTIDDATRLILTFAQRKEDLSGVFTDSTVLPTERLLRVDNFSSYNLRNYEELSDKFVSSNWDVDLSGYQNTPTAGLSLVIAFADEMSVFNVDSFVNQISTSGSSANLTNIKRGWLNLDFGKSVPVLPTLVKVDYYNDATLDQRENAILHAVQPAYK